MDGLKNDGCRRNSVDFFKSKKGGNLHVTDYSNDTRDEQRN